MSIFKGWGFRSWIVFAVLGWVMYTAAGWVYLPASLLGQSVLMVLAACLAVLAVRLQHAWSERAHATAPSQADAPAIAAEKPALSAWQQLGADAQEREEAINRMFDSRIGVVEFDTQWDFEYPHQHSSGVTETAYSSMSFRITRELATLDTRESECLRAAYLLYNGGLIGLHTWQDLTFPIVYEGGKATLLSCEYREPVALPFHGGAGAVRYYANAHPATVDDSASKLLAIASTQMHKPDTPP